MNTDVDVQALTEAAERVEKFYFLEKGKKTFS